MSAGSKLEQHRTLFQRMVAALGIDTEAWAQSGNFPPEEEDRLVQRCVGCLEPGACQARLTQAPALSEPPAYCRNADVLKAMCDER